MPLVFVISLSLLENNQKSCFKSLKKYFTDENIFNKYTMNLLIIKEISYREFKTITLDKLISTMCYFE